MAPKSATTRTIAPAPAARRECGVDTHDPNTRDKLFIVDRCNDHDEIGDVVGTNIGIPHDKTYRSLLTNDENGVVHGSVTVETTSKPEEKEELFLGSF